MYLDTRRPGNAFRDTFKRSAESAKYGTARIRPVFQTRPDQNVHHDREKTGIKLLYTTTVQHHSDNKSAVSHPGNLHHRYRFGVVSAATTRPSPTSIWRHPSFFAASSVTTASDIPISTTGGALRSCGCACDERGIAISTPTCTVRALVNVVAGGGREGEEIGDAIVGGVDSGDRLGINGHANRARETPGSESGTVRACA